MAITTQYRMITGFTPTNRLWHQVTLIGQAMRNVQSLKDEISAIPEAERTLPEKAQRGVYEHTLVNLDAALRNITAMAEARDKEIEQIHTVRTGSVWYRIKLAIRFVLNDNPPRI